MKKNFVLILVLLCFCLFVGCSDSEKDGGISPSKTPASDTGSLPSGFYFDSSSSYDSAKAEYLEDGGVIINRPSTIISSLYQGYLFSTRYNRNIEAGMLTGSVIFDNNTYEYWTSLITKGQDGDGLFKEYFDSESFNTLKRVKLTIKNGKNVKVELVENGFETFTDANGVCYLFADDEKDEYNVKITHSETVETFKIKDNDEITLKNPSNKQDIIELMFVIDTTGSMGDEILFLKKEIDDVISKVQSSNPNSVISLSLLFYRDKGDEYVTRYFDFTNNISLQKENLEKQNAAGGGDYEEAVYKALGEACEKGWSDNSSTKLLIHVADAPSHPKEVKDWSDNVLKLGSKGVKIITIASSGIDKRTEYYFRSQSILTGGCYVYLTDDSGIGASHIEATSAEKPIVEYLNDLLIRLINGYHTGEFNEAKPYDGEIITSPLNKEITDDLTIDFTYKLKDKVFKFNYEKDSCYITISNEKKDINVTEDELNTIYSILRAFDISKLKNDNVGADADEYIILTIKTTESEYSTTYVFTDYSTNDKNEYYFINSMKSLTTFIVKKHNPIYTDK